MTRYNPKGASAPTACNFTTKPQILWLRTWKKISYPMCEQNGAGIWIPTKIPNKLPSCVGKSSSTVWFASGYVRLIRDSNNWSRHGYPWGSLLMFCSTVFPGFYWKFASMIGYNLWPLGRINHLLWGPQRLCLLVDNSIYIYIYKII